MTKAQRISKKIVKAFNKMADDGTLKEMFQVLAEVEKNRQKEQRHRPLFGRKFGYLACQV
jgi:hypothetical protein